MKCFLVIPFLVFLSYSCNAQFLERGNLNLVYNWGKPAKVLLELAKNVELKSKSKIYISGVYDTTLMSEMSLSNFVVSTSEKNADIVVQKTIYQDSIVLIGKDVDKKSEIFTYNFSKNSFELVDVRVYDKWSEIGRMYKMKSGDKVYIQKLSTDYRLVTVYNKDQIDREFIIDLTKSAKSKSVVSALSGFKKPIKSGAVDLKSFKIIIPIKYEETKILMSENGIKYISVFNEHKSALFDSLGNNLTGFIFNGEIIKVHSDQTIQLMKDDYNPMIVDFKGNVICDLQGDFQFSSLVKLNYNFYLIVNSINSPEGFLTPKNEVIRVNSLYSVEGIKNSFNKDMSEDGVFVYKISSFKYGAVKKNGGILKDYEPQAPLDWTPSFSDEGLMVVSKIVDKKEKYGYIDKDFNLVIPCIYEYAEYFSKGKGYVKLNGESFYINTSGKRVD